MWVDVDDFQRLCQHRWTALRQGHGCYAVRKDSSRTIYMHRELLAVTSRVLVVDHVDGNTLNNRRINLRVATRQQNAANQPARGGSSKYKGVYVHRHHGIASGKFRAGIVVDGKARALGYFWSEEDAARAYDNAALEHFGEFAKLNFECSGRQRRK